MNNSPASSDVSALLPEVAQLMVTALNLETSPEGIQPDAPLYGGDLGLDSIDILEVPWRSPRNTAFNCGPTMRTTPPSTPLCAA